MARSLFKSSGASLSHIYFSINSKKTGQQPDIEEWETKTFKSDFRSRGKTPEEVFKPESVVKADLDIYIEEGEPGDLTFVNHKRKMQAYVVRERAEEKSYFSKKDAKLLKALVEKME